METNTSSSSTSTRVKSKGVLFGLLMVAAGLLFLSFNFGWIDTTLRPIVFSWPMLFIVFAIVSFSKNNYFATLFLLILGLFFLLPRVALAYPGLLPGIDGDFARHFWPLLLIIFGVAFIIKVVNKKQRGTRNYSRVEATDGFDGIVKRNVIFGGSESIFLEPVFRGGELSATFGGIVLDLRRAELPDGETYLDIDATFGGVELYIPGDWMVEAKFQTMLGGFEDKRLISEPNKSRKLILNGDLVFGGCEIR